MKIIKIILLACTLFQVNYSFAAIEYRQVEAVGFGENENAAIQDALIQALSQVKGTYIKADKIKAVQRSIKDNKEIIKKESKSKISSYTMGLISSYDLISSKKDADKVFEVHVKATIPFYNSGAQVNRLRLAILPFRINPEYQNPESEKFINNWTQELEDALVQSRKFAILDRNYQKEIKSELESYLDGHKFEETSRLGQRIGTDYIVTGTLINFYGVNSDLNSLEVRRNKISLRIIDVASGQIKYARKVFGAKISAQQILDSIYPIPVVGVKDDQLTLGTGEGNVRIGDVYELMLQGKQIYDPYTKESLGFEESSMGQVKIIKINQKTSIAAFENKADLAKLNQSSRLILRSIPAPTTPTLSPSSEENADW